MNRYIIGTKVEMQASFADSCGTPKAPDAVACKVRDPAGAISDVSSTIQNPAPGVYTALFTPSLCGLHSYLFTGSGDVATAGEGNFIVESEFLGGV